MKRNFFLLIENTNFLKFFLFYNFCVLMVVMDFSNYDCFAFCIFYRKYL